MGMNQTQTSRIQVKNVNQNTMRDTGTIATVHINYRYSFEYVNHRNAVTKLASVEVCSELVSPVNNFGTMSNDGMYMAR